LEKMAKKLEESKEGKGKQVNSTLSLHSFLPPCESSHPQIQINPLHLLVDELNRRNHLEQVEADMAYQQKKGTNSVKEDDPFARRPCLPLPMTFQPKGSEKGQKEKEPLPSSSSALPPPPTLPPSTNPEDPIAIHQTLDIDLDISVPGLFPFSLPLPLPLPFLTALFRWLAETSWRPSGPASVGPSVPRSRNIQMFKRQKGLF